MEYLGIPIVVVPGIPDNTILLKNGEQKVLCRLEGTHGKNQNTLGEKAEDQNAVGQEKSQPD